MAQPRPLDRRSFLKGRRELHVASAVVLTRPGGEPAVADSLRALRGVEVHGWAKGRLVVVIEGDSSGEVGSLLAAMAALPGVVAANLVYEELATGEGSADDDA